MGEREVAREGIITPKYCSDSVNIMNLGKYEKTPEVVRTTMAFPSNA